MYGHITRVMQSVVSIHDKNTPFKFYVSLLIISKVMGVGILNHPHPLTPLTVNKFSKDLDTNRVDL